MEQRRSELRARDAGDERLAVRWHLYTDGAGPDEDEDAGDGLDMQKVAGYGVAELQSAIEPETVRAPRADCDAHNANPPTRVSVPLGQITDQGAEGGDDVRATLTWAIAGNVATATDVAKDRADPKDDIGAAAHTNNAGELSAMYYALQRAVARQARKGREHIHTDSLYAMHMTTGRWMPRKQGRRNAPLIAKLRALWRRVQRRRPGEVELRHVRSHIRV